MNRAERLKDELLKDGCDVEYAFISPNVFGLYVKEEAPYIVIRPDQTTACETSTLAHEAGHHYTGLTGEQDRDEVRADRWATNYLLSPQDIVRATIKGAQSIHDLSEALQLPEEFLHTAIEILALQYGNEIVLERYRLHLHPIWVEDMRTGQIWPGG